MKLRNKKTGEIGKIVSYDDKKGIFAVKTDKGVFWYYYSLAELNEEWEDYEEPKEYWYLENNGEVVKTTYECNLYEEKMQEIGNYFDTRKEAEKAVEKLKAWKRLKDKGFRFIGKTYETDKRFGSIFYKVDEDTYSEDIINELDLLFGGEE